MCIRTVDQKSYVVKIYEDFSRSWIGIKVIFLNVKDEDCKGARNVTGDTILNLNCLDRN